MTQIQKRDLDDKAKKYAMNKLWQSTMTSRKAVTRWTPEKTSNRGYFELGRLEAKLMLAWRVGELNFLTNRRKESLKNLGSTECLVRVCGGEDTLEHVSECFGYQARLGGQSEADHASYLRELHKERTKKYNKPLIFIKY